MGYSGQPMLVVKANRALLRKRNFSDLKSLYLKSSDKTALEFKEISAEELARIKHEIRRNAKRAAKVEVGLFAMCTMVVFAIVYWLIFT